VAQVQKNGGTVNGATSIVTSLGSATTAGNSILLMISGAGTLTTPAGFTSRSPQVNLAGQYLFDKLVASGNSTDTPTLTQGGTYNATWQITEYSGISGFVTSNGANTGFGETPPNTTASITPTTGNRLIVAFAGLLGSGISTTFTAGDPTGWTNSFTGEQSNYAPPTSGAGRDGFAAGWASRQVTTAGSTAYSTTFSWTSSGSAPAATNIIAAYTHSAGGLTNPVMPAGLGTLTLGGQANRLARSRLFPAGLGTLTLAGPVVNLIRSGGGPKTLPAGLGFPLLGGQQAILRYARKMPALTGTLTATGKMVVLTYVPFEGDIVMPVSAGVLAMSGHPAFLDVTRVAPKTMKLQFGRKVYLRRW
jgi:hypothetical protein